MKKILSLTAYLFLLFNSDAQSYKNPVIPGFYPDPSVCRAGDDYYLVNSSFEYFPGVPIWHSKDLIHWKQIGNVLNRQSQLDLTACKPSNGIYASTIRYHKGVFYMVTTVVMKDRDYQNFYVTATNPAGPWSDPVWVNQSGIDPSLFWDDDDKMYFVSNRAYKPSDERAIYGSELNPATGKRLTEPKLLWRGSGGSYVEGPHIYKKDGFYYLLTAEGGTAYGHTVAIGRSNSFWGPYTSAPNNPILTNRMSYGIIQGTGHADLVQAPDSSWWMVHLAFRPAVDGIHFIGRETCLTPVEWKKGEWPVVNKNGTTDEVIKTLTPNYQSSEPIPFQSTVTTTFDKPLGFEWLYLRNPDSSNYQLTSKGLVLKGSAISLNDLASPTFIGRRQQHFNFHATANVSFHANQSNEEAGLSLLMTNRFHYDVFLSTNGNKQTINVRYVLDSLEHIMKTVEISDAPVTLKITGNKKDYTLSFLQNNQEIKLATVNTRFLGTEVTGGYNGVIIGMYATGNGSKSTAAATFSTFEYQPLP